MKKTKFDPKLLKEEVKRFKMLESYDFYHEEQEEPTYKDEELLLGSELSEIDEPEDDLAPADEEGDGDIDAGAEISDELGVGDGEEKIGDMPDNEEPAIEEPPVDDTANDVVDDAVEVDVTSLVQGSEEATRAAQQASSNTEQLLAKLNDLESRIGRMDAVSAKIDGLEQEMIKRNPTSVEKLEMQSLNSFPYSQKLTDYWAEKKGAYDVMDTENKKEKEYVLTQDDVDYGYSEPNIKKSFSRIENDYEEEDV